MEGSLALPVPKASPDGVSGHRRERAAAWSATFRHRAATAALLLATLSVSACTPSGGGGSAVRPSAVFHVYIDQAGYDAAGPKAATVRFEGDGAAGH